MTQKEISEMLGLSVSTVSLALRDYPKIKKETCQKVKKLAAAMNYRPSEIARSLALKRSFTVGIAISSFSTPHDAQLAEAIQKKLRAAQYLGIVLATGYSNDHYNYVVDTFIRKRVDGVICGGLTYEEVKILKQVNIVPLLYEKTFGLDVDFVTVDKYKGAYMAVEHLIKLGRRKIACLCINNDMEERLIGYRDALLHFNIPLKKKWIIKNSGFYKTGFEEMQRLLSFKEKPDAVFAKNDATAIGAIRAIVRKGLKVPRDIAVVGFDNIEESRYLDVPLTTVDQPREKIAEKLVEIFLNRISGNNIEERQTIFLAPKLIVRESCGYKRG